MHANMPKVVLFEKEWFLLGYKHFKTPIGHFIKVTKPFAKEFYL